MNFKRSGQWLVFPFVMLLATSGCTTKSKAQKQATAAFRAGQAQSAVAADKARNGITFSGPVLNPIVPWTEGLTLAKAILAAHWSGLNDPHSVILTRAGERVELTLDQSVAAAELPLEPGDQVELVP